MNINFDKIFLTKTGELKQPEAIAESILLIKDIGQSYSIKSSMLTWLSEHGFNTSFLPEIRSIYDHAREITNTGPGKEIREEDFIVLMERSNIDDLLPKFREKNFRNYKKNLLRFLDFRGLTSGGSLPKSILDDLSKNELSDKVIEDVVKYINSYDLYFKGQIFDKAIKVAGNSEAAEEVFSLGFHDQEISAKEKDFLMKLNSQKLDFNLDGKYSTIANVFTKENEVKVSGEDIDFHVSASPLDEAKKIKHLILDKVASSNFTPDDFNIVCSDENLFQTLNNLFQASKIPAYSSYSYSDGNISTDILRLLIAAIEGETQTILNFYNLYLTEEPMAFPDVSEIDLPILYSKLIPKKDPDLKLNLKTEKDRDIRKKKEGKVRNLIKTLNIKDGKLSAKNALDRLYYKLKDIKSILEIELEFDPYQYEEVLSKIFGENIIYSEMLEYLYLISAKSNKISPNREQKGVRINMMNEPVSDSKCIIFAGLTQDNFLKTGNSIKFLQKENYQQLYNFVYGIGPDLTLVENFKIFTSGNIERVAFFVPQWGDEVIPSTKIDDLLTLFDRKEVDIEIISEKHKFENIPELQNREFNYSIGDLLDDKETLKEIQIHEQESFSGNGQFNIKYSGDGLEAKLSSASKLESFMSCPAKFVHDLNLEYDEIESQMPFTKGNFFHKITEDFINYFKGKELLSAEIFDLVKDDFLWRKEISNTALNFFSEYYFGAIDKDHDRFKPSYDLLKDKIKESGIEKEINKYYEDQMENNPFGNHMFTKQKYSIINFIARLIFQMGATPVSVTNSFLTEVKFCDMEVCSDPEIKIREGYIDLMFVDADHKVQIIDIKSTKKFKEYDEEIKNYQRVQILLYREAVLKQMNEEGGVNFKVSKEGRNPDCSILPDDYFTLNNASGEIGSYYLSNESPYMSSCDDEVYSEFLTKLKDRLGDHKKFFSIANSNCEYCSLGASCPNNEQSKFEEIKDFKPTFENELPTPEFKENKDSSNESKPKEYIMFSGEKDEAIKTPDSVIISAGAGAGKTEVLSSKYVHLLVNKPEVDIENIVCITFTKKAAGEMQNRIYRKLDEVIQSRIFVASDLGNDIEEYKLNNTQINKLESCKEKFFDKNLISTFHSFCNDQISKYGYSSESLKIFDIDQSISEDHQIKKETVKYLKDHYQDDFSKIIGTHNTFKEWLDSRHLMYSGDREGGFIPDIIGLYSELKLSGKDLEISQWNESIEKYLEQIEERFIDVAPEYKELRENALKMIDNEIVSADDKSAIKLSDLRNKINKNQEFSYKSATKKFPELFNTVEALFNSDGYKVMNKHSVDMGLTKDEWAIKKAVMQIILGLDSHISEFKRSKGLLEQNDLHLMFLEMLKDNALKLNLQDQFKHLLIDEFQDTNWLQDRIIGELKSENNKLFIVGDKKQSIYRFQQCDVQIYEKYLEKFKTLTFTDNFRSTPEIVNFNNEIFAKDSDTVRKEYKIIDDAERSISKKNSVYDTSINFYNIFSPEHMTKGDNKLSINDNNRLIKMSEAAFVSNTIKKNCPTAEDYGNWAILIRKYTHIGYITEAFRKMEIPYTLILKRDLFKLNEVLEFIDILKVGMGVIKLSEIEFIDNAEKIFEDIKDTDDISSMIYKIFYSKTYKNYLYGFEDAETKLSNIEILISNLMALLTDAGSDKENFLTDIDINIENNSAGVVVHNPKAVTIMTVHSAKGLEFDNLILANIDEYDNNMTGLFNYLNLWDGKDNYVDFSMSGYKTITGESQGNFFLNEYIKYKNKEFTTREKANLLYVAMTRAKKSLSVIISTKKKEHGANDDSKSLGWAKYLKEYGDAMNDNIKGFQFHPLPITDFDLTPFIDPKDDKETRYEISVEKEYDLAFTYDKDIESATSIAHKDDEPKHETGSSIALDTGNFVHLFLSKEIDNIFKPDYDLNTKLKEFKKLNSESQGVNLKTVRNMLHQVISDEKFRSLIAGGKLLCEKNIVQVSDGKKLQGYIDLIIIKDDEVIVLDYKTYLKNFPDDDTLKKYNTQVDIYADALSNIYVGKKVKKYLYFIGVGEAELRELDY